MKIDKKHASILFLIGFMIIVLLSTMNCYSLDKKIKIMQNRSTTEQQIYEGFETDMNLQHDNHQKFMRFKNNLNKKLCSISSSLTDEEKKEKFEVLRSNFKNLEDNFDNNVRIENPNDPNDPHPSNTHYITQSNYENGKALFRKLDQALNNESLRNTMCNEWKETTQETFIADFNSSGVKTPVKKPEIVEDTLNELNKKPKNIVRITGSNEGVVNIGNNLNQKSENFRQSNRILRNSSKVGKTSESSIKTNILCPGININERRVNIDNLMPEFYYLKDHVKDLIMANQSYEKAFVK